MSANFISPVGSAGDAQAVEETRFSWSDSFQRYTYIALLAVTALLTYSYWNMLSTTAEFWADDQYSHGWIVPLIALYLIYALRPNPQAHEPADGEDEATFFGALPATQFRNAVVGASIAVAAAGYFLGMPTLQGVAVGVLCLGGFAYVMLGQGFSPVSDGERWAGLALVLAAYGARFYWGVNLYMDPIDRLSFLMALVGGFLLVGGLSLLRWTGAAIGFLVFMYPLPTGIEGKLLLNLQKLAAMASEVVLTIMGQPAIREGNRIYVDGIPLEVAEACSGLRMVTIFGAMAVAMMVVTKRPWWDKLIILLSAIPIALIVNITRIVVTALLYRAFPESEVVQQLVHDYAGLAMMPLAIGLLYLELRVLKMLTLEEEGVDLGGTYGIPSGG